MRVRGIGIDIISVKRVQRFFKANGICNSRRLLHSAERRELGAHLTPLVFAKLFAAKEAYSKAMGEPLTGIAGFTKIRVKFLPQGQFRVKSLYPSHTKKTRATGFFFRQGDILGSQVVCWDSSDAV